METQTRDWALGTSKERLEVEILRVRKAYRLAKAKAKTEERGELYTYHKMLMGVFRERFVENERLSMRDALAEERTTRNRMRNT